MTPRSVFIAKYEDLCDAIKTGSEIRILQLSGTLRHFIVDGDNLMHQVNR